MNENKLKNFLVNGFAAKEGSGEIPLDITGVDGASVEGQYVCEEGGEVRFDTPETVPDSEDMREIRSELLKIRYILEDLREEGAPGQEQQVSVQMPDMSAYLTSREQMKTLTASLDKRDADSSNKSLVRAMEQISVMREDFFKLCQGMRERIGEMSAEDVLASFEAYSVDMENILTDGGVYIGPFPYDRLNTLHQRIIGVIPTDDEEKNGMIAERLSDGYKIGNKVLLKEKVRTYRYTEATKAEETASQTISDKESEEKESERQEEEE